MGIANQNRNMIQGHAWFEAPLYLTHDEGMRSEEKAFRMELETGKKALRNKSKIYFKFREVEQGRLGEYKVILRRVRTTIAVVVNQKELHMFTGPVAHLV